MAFEVPSIISITEDWPGCGGPPVRLSFCFESNVSACMSMERKIRGAKKEKQQA